jgi:hypothetical protein
MTTSRSPTCAIIKAIDRLLSLVSRIYLSQLKNPMQIIVLSLILVASTHAIAAPASNAVMLIVRDARGSLDQQQTSEAQPEKQTHERDARNQTSTNARSQLSKMGIDFSVNKLLDFAAQGDVNTVTLLLSAGLSPTASDQERHVTALHNAASQGHVELLRLLVSMQANVNAPDWQGATPLVYGAYAANRRP